MKWSRVVSGFACLLIAAAPVAAQQSLGDVAGSIKLKRPEGESVVIDQNSVGQNRRTQTGSTDAVQFRDAIEGCLTETRALYDLVMETRDGSSFYRDEWRGRVAEVGLRLDGAREEMGMVSTAGRYEEAYDLAAQGANNAIAGLEILQGAIADDRPVYSQAGVLSKEAIRLLTEAKTALGVVSREDAAEDDPGLINPIEANQRITALCRKLGADGSSAYESCVAQQRAAVDTMTARSGPGVGLDATAFNKIRNNCRFEWPDNYVSQDRCEQQRIAAKKSQ